MAFAAPSREAVARFHEQALRHGGRDNGAPGLRPDYGEHYYAAFVVDPDGYAIEAVITDQPTPSDEFFRSLETTRTQALVAQDMELAQALHAPGYHLITPGGKSFDRQSYLGQIASGELRYAKWETGAMEVRSSPFMAMVRYQARLGFPSGTEVRCWHTDSYELIDDRWQAVWSQATAISEPVQP